MNDREMLSLAAKAEGHAYPWKLPMGFGERDWNPLADDGDALRLALKLGLCIEPYPFYSLARHSVIVKQRTRGDQMREANPTEVVEVYGTDAAAATRRAIVRSAAAVGMTPNVSSPSR